MTEPIDYAGIDHVQLAMPAGREDDARRFYADVLALREVPKPPALAGRGGCWFSSEDGRVHVHLGVDPEFRPARKAHPALAVASLDALRERLAQVGADVVEDDALDVPRFYTADPFGNRIELVEARTGRREGGGDVADAATDVAVLVISGPAGVGKTSVAHEASLHLQAAEVAHAVIDTDELDHLYPPPDDLPTLAEQNLAAMWQAFAERGTRRLILVGVYLDRPSELEWIARAVPGAHFTLARLRASEAGLHARLRRREIGTGMASQWERTKRQMDLLRADGSPDVDEIDTDGLSVPEIARQVLDLWPSSH